MILGGFIPTNQQPMLEKIIDMCSKAGVEFFIKNNHIDFFSPDFQHKIILTLYSNGIGYRTIMWDMMAYFFAFCSMLVFMTQTIGWRMLMFLTLLSLLFFFGVKIKNDKKLRRVVLSITPQEYIFLPEMATHEHLRWMHDSSYCPGCGRQYVQYFEKCPECGLALGKPQKPISTVNSTIDIKIDYYFNSNEKNSC